MPGAGPRVLSKGGSSREVMRPTLPCLPCSCLPGPPLLCLCVVLPPNVPVLQCWWPSIWSTLLLLHPWYCTCLNSFSLLPCVPRPSAAICVHSNAVDPHLWSVLACSLYHFCFWRAVPTSNYGDIPSNDTWFLWGVPLLHPVCIYSEVCLWLVLASRVRSTCWVVCIPLVVWLLVLFLAALYHCAAHSG